MAVHPIALVRALLLAAHLHDAELLTRFLQSGGVCIVGNVAGGEEVQPLVQRHTRPSVEVVHLQDIVFRIELIDIAYLELLLLVGT